MSLNRLWLFLAVALPVLAAVIAPMSTVDLTYHLRAGQEILGTGAIPVADTWTFTAAGLPWVDQQWGAQVVLSAVEQATGWTGLVLLRAGLTAVIFASLVSMLRQRRLDPRIATLVTLAAFVVAAPAMALRPQLLGMACLAVVLVLVVDRRVHPGRLWLVPVITIVWANLHGSFFLGPAVLGLAWLEDLHDGVQPRNRTLVVALVAAAAACLTPTGPWVYVYAVGLSVNPLVTARITEWQPTSLRDLPGILFYVSVLAVVVLLARRGRATPWPALVWLGLFVAIGVYAQRGIAWWPLGAVPAVAALLAIDVEGTTGPTVRLDTGTARRLNAVIAGAIALVIVVALPAWRPVDPSTGVPVATLTDAPPGITDALRQLSKPGDRVLNAQAWGSWFEYALPDRRYAIDSRIEFFPAAVWDDYLAVISGAHGWQARLATWAPSWFVVAGDDPALEARLGEVGWNVVFRDDDGVVLTRMP